MQEGMLFYIYIYIKYIYYIYLYKYIIYNIYKYILYYIYLSIYLAILGLSCGIVSCGIFCLSVHELSGLPLYLRR